jgi:hypothetical protein
VPSTISRPIHDAEIASRVLLPFVNYLCVPSFLVGKSQHSS